MSGPRPMGTTPSHCAARRNGARFGQVPATQIGTRGRCTGVGRNGVGMTSGLSGPPSPRNE